MKIGDLARASQTPVETIRFYEREGLLPPAPRSEGNYRVYTTQHAEQLAFVRHCRSLDMSLDEVRVLLKLRSQPDAACDEVNALLDAHIGHVAQRIRSLRLLEKQLKALRERCTDPDAARVCGILDGLARAGGSPESTGTGPGGGHVKATHGRLGGGGA